MSANGTTLSYAQYNFDAGLTPVKLGTKSDIGGTYFNGTSNNGVGATLTFATGVLTIDGTSVLLGDRVVLAGQAAGNSNGIYICTQEGALGVSAILQRSADQQSIEQLKPGQYVSVFSGVDNAAGLFILAAPLPANLGIDALIWGSPLASPVFKILTTSSATPGTLRTIDSVLQETATTMTSGNLVGVRGEVDLVGASGGFLYGLQGKIIPSGTLSGSVWAAPVFGQFDLTNATINAGQTAPVWADYGANGGTFTNVTGMRMFSGTNTISTLTLNAMIYLYGKATNLFELSGSSSTYIAAGGSGALSGTIKKIAFTIDGVTYYLPCATVVS